MNGVFASKGNSIYRSPESLIALALIRRAIAHGMAKLPVLADAAYGDNRAFREQLLEMGLDFAVGVSSKTRVWRSGVQPIIPPRGRGKKGRPVTVAFDPKGSEPVELAKLAQEWDEQKAFAPVP